MTRCTLQVQQVADREADPWPPAGRRPGSFAASTRARPFPGGGGAVRARRGRGCRSGAVRDGTNREDRRGQARIENMSASPKDPGRRAGMFPRIRDDPGRTDPPVKEESGKRTACPGANLPRSGPGVHSTTTDALSRRETRTGRDVGQAAGFLHHPGSHVDSAEGTDVHKVQVAVRSVDKRSSRRDLV